MGVGLKLTSQKIQFLNQGLLKINTKAIKNNQMKSIFDNLLFINPKPKCFSLEWMFNRMLDSNQLIKFLNRAQITCYIRKLNKVWLIAAVDERLNTGTEQRYGDDLIQSILRQKGKGFERPIPEKLDVSGRPDSDNLTRNPT